MHGLESFIERNEMVFLLVFKQPFNAERLLTSFESLVRETPAVTARFVRTPKGYDFQPLPAHEVDAVLVREREQFVPWPLEEILNEYVPTNQGLAARIRRVDDVRVALMVNHVYANGFSVLRLIERWLGRYAGDTAAALPAPPPARKSAVAGVPATVAYVTQFLLRAGAGTAKATVDLSHARAPARGGNSYFVERYWLTTEQTRGIVQRSKSRGLSVTEFLCSEAAGAMFAMQPDRTRVCISVPADLSAWFPTAELDAPGNATGSLILQIRRHQNADAQVRQAFRWVSRGVNYWLPRLIGAVSSEHTLFRNFARQAATPVPDRAPFENFSCAISSVGVVRGPRTQEYLAALSAHTRIQTVFLCAITLNGRMSVEVSAPLDIFDAQEVRTLASSFIAAIT